MKTIGIIGGMSCESTALYYERLNGLVRTRLGGLHSARVIVWSFDFADIAALQAQGRWDDAAAALADAGKRLEGAGAEVVLLATNTMHKVFDTVQAGVSVPMLHIADATGAAIARAGLKRPGLIATAFTMEQDFYVGRLRERFGLDVRVPDAEDRSLVHGIIYDELCRGRVAADSRATFERVAGRLIEGGADCIILGCTEVTMLLGTGNVSVPVFDTTSIHVAAAVDAALDHAEAKAA
jgi:aspartate racemase